MKSERVKKDKSEKADQADSSKLFHPFTFPLLHIR